MTAEPAPVPARPNAFRRLAGVLFSPDPTFREIAAAPDWLIPLLLITAVTVLATVMISPHIDFETTIREQMQEQGVAEERIERQIEGVRKFQKFGAIANGLVAPVMMLIIAGVVLIAMKMFGSDMTFRQSFAVTNYAWMPHVIKSLLFIPLVMRIGSVTPEQMPTVLRSNLGFLADAKEQPVLFALLASFDAFTIWVLILFIVGYGHASKLRRATVSAILISLWVVIVLVKLGFAALRGGAA